MTDGQTFLLVFILIYLSDCLVWLTPSGCALIAFSRRRFLVRRASVFFHAVRKGFAILQPLPPFGAVFAAQVWPISLSCDGIAPLSRENPNPGPALTPPPGSHTAMWEDITSIRSEEARLVINGMTFAICVTAEEALGLARAVTRIHASSPGERDREIEKLVARTLDPRRPARRSLVFFRAVRGLRLNASVLFFAVFLVIPYAYWRFEDEKPFFFTVLAVWILMLRIVIEFWLLHRRFHPAQSQERWTHAILAILFPHYALRSLDVLSRGFLAGSHPLALATALATPDELAAYADRISRDTEHPVPFSVEDPTMTGIAETFRSRYLQPAIAKLLQTVSERAPLPAANGRANDAEVSECPRCRIPYDRPGLVCQDCGGIPTIPLTRA